MSIQRYSVSRVMMLALMMLAAGQVGAAVVTDGLVSWWKFDETSGTSAADSYGSNNGTLVNFGASPSWTNDTPGAASSGALFFDGDNDVVDCGTAFGAISNAMTVEVWIKREAITESWDIYLTKLQDGNNRWYLRVNADGRAGSYGKSGGIQIYTSGDFYSTGTVDSNEWHHVALTASSDSNCVWYLDGVAKGAGTLAQASFANAGKLLIGAYDGAAMAIQALMDDVRIYNRALSAEEILQNYRAINGDSGVVTTDLVSWWKLDESSGSKARDSWGGGYGTLVNFSATPTWTNDTPGEASSGALYFDGVNDYINSLTKLSSVSNALTAEVWIKYFGVPSPVDVFLAKYQDNNNRWYMRVNPGNTALIYAVLGGSLIISPIGELLTPAVVPADNWLHMVFTATRNGTCNWYVNGEWQSSNPVNDRSFANTANLLIGAYNGGALPINAVIDDVRIYDRALTAEEVWQNYRVTVPGPPPGTLILVQ